MALRETLDTIRSVPAPRDEENTKFQIITPILGDLGWNPARQEILYEYRVGGKIKGKVDIALMGPKRCVALIEAKAPEEKLADHVEQVLGYAFYEGVDVCVLTNGLEWWLYLPREDGPPEERLFTTLLIKHDPTEQLTYDLKTFLGKDNLVRGQAKKRAKRVLEARHQAAFLESELPVLWKSMLNMPDDELVELLTQRTYDNLNLRPERNQVVAVLRGLPVPSVVSPNRSVTVSSSPKSRTSRERTKPAIKPKQSSTTRARSEKPTGIQLWNEYYPVKYWIDILVQVAEALYRQHGLDFESKLTHAKFGKAGVSRNRADFDSPKEIGSTGIFLYSKLQSKQIRPRAERFLEIMGHPSSDLELMYD